MFEYGKIVLKMNNLNWNDCKIFLKNRLTMDFENAPLLKNPSFQQLMQEEENKDDWDWDETQGTWVNTAK